MQEMQHEISRAHGKHFASLPGTAGITWLQEGIFMLEIFTINDSEGSYFPYLIHRGSKNVCWNFTHSKVFSDMCHLCQSQNWVVGIQRWIRASVCWVLGHPCLQKRQTEEVYRIGWCESMKKGRISFSHRVAMKPGSEDTLFHPEW